MDDRTTNPATQQTGDRPVRASMDPRDLVAALGESIDLNGIASIEMSQLTTLIAAGRRVGVSEVVIGVLVDPTEPAVVRERAFAKAAARIVGRHLATGDTLGRCRPRSTSARTRTTRSSVLPARSSAWSTPAGASSTSR
jgi:hypothetical protein